MEWQALTTLDQLDLIASESQIRPVLIFKHSTRCSISSVALDKLERKWKIEDKEVVTAYFLDLIRFREISNEISERYSIYHQSPQAILLHKGKVVYEESHFSISYDEIESQVESAQL